MTFYYLQRTPLGWYSTNFYVGRFHPEVQPLTLLYTIFTKKVPLSYTFNSIDIWYPFHIPCLELCISFDRFK